MTVLWPEPDGFHVGTIEEANPLLRERHYLGAVDWGWLVVCQWVGGEVVGAMVWKHPTSRRLPSDGSWLELARWCLTPEGGPNAGSRMHRYAVSVLRERFPAVTTLVSYSDPSVGHTGSLYKACNWRWRPTWVQLKPPPSGGGSWDGIKRQAPKARWIFEVRRDPRREEYLRLEDSYRHLYEEAIAFSKPTVARAVAQPTLLDAETAIPRTNQGLESAGGTAYRIRSTVRVTPPR